MHMYVVLPPKTPSLSICGAVFYSQPFSKSKFPVLWGFLGVGVATGRNAAAEKGEETSEEGIL